MRSVEAPPAAPHNPNGIQPAVIIAFSVILKLNSLAFFADSHMLRRSGRHLYKTHRAYYEKNQALHSDALGCSVEPSACCGSTPEWNFNQYSYAEIHNPNEFCL